MNRKSATLVLISVISNYNWRPVKRLSVFQRLLCASLFAIILCSTSAFAQKQFGSVQGLVHDAEGQPIPGASVIASSELHGSASASTDKSGRYRIEPLIPGTYNLEARLVGFQSTMKSDARVSIGSTITVDFLIEPERLRETVIVQGESPMIDSTTTATSHIIQSEIIRGLPLKQEEFRSLLALTPGVGSDGVAYGSSRNTANRVWIDGVDMSSPSNGGLIAVNPVNWIEEVQVVGNGAPAEYGNYAGVIGNFVTRSGGNQFHGLVETFFHNENLDSSNVPDPGPEIPYKSMDVSAQIGGPIQRDKLWFFSGIHYQYDQNIPFGYDGVQTEEFPKFITKLTYKPNQTNTIQSFAKFAHRRFDGGEAEAGVLPETTTVDTCQENGWNVTWISLLTEATTLEGGFGGQLNRCDFLPRNGDIAAQVNEDTGVESGNARHTRRERQFRPQGTFSLTHYAQDYLGSHEFKLGTQFHISSVREETSINGGFVYYSYTSDGYAYTNRYSYLQDTNKTNGDVDQVGLYAHDSWNLNSNLSLSLGVRWDHNRGSTDRGVVSSSDPVAPRIGVIWKIRENQPIVLKAHYGDYYDALLTQQFINLSDQLSGGQLESLVDNVWEPSDRTEQIVYVSSPDNKQPFIRQFTVGLDQELPAGIAVGAHYIYKRWHNILEDVELNPHYEPVPFVNPITGETITVYSRLSEEKVMLLTNPEGLYKRYDALEVSLDRRFMNQLALSASFVYSKARGNIPNEREVFPFTEFLNDPNNLINSTGRLINDPTFAWKVSGIYNVPYGINLGFFFWHESGDTWEPLLRLPKVVNQGGEIFGLPRGSFRLSSQNILDLRVEKQFAMLNGQFRFTVDIFNVMNAANVNGVGRVWGRENYGQPTGFNKPREIRLGVRYTF